MDSSRAWPTRRWRGLLVTVVVVAAVLATVAGLGGFERRAVRSIPLPAGTDIDAGNLVFRLDTATVQYLTEATGDPWRVVVSGAVRNPNDESLAPLSGNYGNMVGIDRPSDQFVVDPDYGLGPVPAEPAWSGTRRVVPPVDRWMEFRATFRFTADFLPADGFEVGLVPMEFTANAILGLNDAPQWNPDSFSQPWTVTVPLTRIPDADY